MEFFEIEYNPLMYRCPTLIFKIPTCQCSENLGEVAKNCTVLGLVSCDVCLYVCIYVSMFVWLYGCMLDCMYVSMFVCMYACMRICMYVCRFVKRRETHFIAHQHRFFGSTQCVGNTRTHAHTHTYPRHTETPIVNCKMIVSVRL